MYDGALARRQHRVNIVLSISNALGTDRSTYRELIDRLIENWSMRNSMYVCMYKTFCQKQTFQREIIGIFDPFYR